MKKITIPKEQLTEQELNILQPFIDTAETYLEISEKMKVTNDEEEIAVNNTTVQIKEILTNLDAHRKTFVKPHYDTQKRINGAFKLITDPLTSAKDNVSKKVVDYKVDKEKRRQVELEKLQKKFEESDDPSIEHEIVQLEQDKVSGIRKKKQVSVVDLALVPREYLIADIKKITQALKDGHEIPGVQYIDVYSHVS